MVTVSLRRFQNVLCRAANQEPPNRSDQSIALSLPRAKKKRVPFSFLFFFVGNSIKHETRSSTRFSFFFMGRSIVTRFIFKMENLCFFFGGNFFFGPFFFGAARAKI